MRSCHRLARAHLGHLLHTVRLLTTGLGHQGGARSRLGEDQAFPEGKGWWLEEGVWWLEEGVWWVKERVWGLERERVWWLEEEMWWLEKGRWWLEEGI